jgi:two-component system, OmpR family, response regulator ChvI
MSVVAPKRIALVDDDRNILTSLTLALESQGFAVRTYTGGREALAGFATRAPDLAVLDIKMPGMDGMTLLQETRKTYTFPVVFLTSKDDEVDALMGFQLGADDFITKPFSPRLLIARIHAVLRRYEAPSEGQNVADRIICGSLVLDDARHACALSETPVTLTVTEYLLLRALAARPGHVKSRAQLMDAAYGPQTYVDDRTIDSHIRRIRQKLRAADPAFDAIETLYGLGYRYREGGDAP